MTLTPPFALGLDHYELTMLEAYLEKSHAQSMAVFEFFIRPHQNRQFFVSCGGQSLTEWLQNLSFSGEDLEFLECRGYSKKLIEHLRTWRFKGELYMIPEGRIFFANEPVAQVIAPLDQAQLIETQLINRLHFQILSASKAARIHLAARGQRVVDFGMRRAHSNESAFWAARCAFICGFSSTSNVLAAQAFNIPLSGTMAHSYIQSYPDEESAFVDYAKTHRQNTVLLIDTYDTRQGAFKAAKVAKDLAQTDHFRIRGVRIDSGDLAQLSHDVRVILNENGAPDLEIVVSGGLDEYDLDQLTRSTNFIDAFGVGTKFVTSSDQAFLDCAYKLVEHGHEPVIKLSAGKRLWPGRKQVYRRYSDSGQALADDLRLYEEEPQGDEPLLVPQLIKGQKQASDMELNDYRNTFLRDLRSFEWLTKDPLFSRPPDTYPVQPSTRLKELAERLVRSHRTP